MAKNQNIKLVNGYTPTVTSEGDAKHKVRITLDGVNKNGRKIKVTYDADIWEATELSKQIKQCIKNNLDYSRSKVQHFLHEMNSVSLI